MKKYLVKQPVLRNLSPYLCKFDNGGIWWTLHKENALRFSKLKAKIIARKLKCEIEGE